MERPGAAAFGALSVLERPGSELRAEGSRLVRRRDGREQILGCTDAEGTGEIRDLAVDPAGLVFVAAERGLFCVSPEVLSLDPVWRDASAPAGAPTSVHVDAKRRVWLATEEEIGVLDPSFGWGRKLTREDGLPGGPPYRLAGDGGDSLLVLTGGGVFRYQLDHGPRPAVTGVWVEGKALEPDETVAGTFGHPLFLEAAGTASGGASFRWRLDGNHVWRELGVLPIEDIPPGSHVLDVIAVDRDLARSAPASVRIEYALPPQYEEEFVLGIAGLLIVLACGCFLVRARREGGGWATWVRVPVSAAIAIAFGVQVLAGVVPHAKGWPFIGFSMYTGTYEEGSAIYDSGLAGIDADRSVRKLNTFALVPFADDRWQVLWPIIDGGDAVSREWILRFNEVRPRSPIVGLQVRAWRRRLTPDGAVPVAPLILSSCFLEEDRGGR